MAIGREVALIATVRDQGQVQFLKGVERQMKATNMAVRMTNGSFGGLNKSMHSFHGRGDRLRLATAGLRREIGTLRNDFLLLAFTLGLGQAALGKFVTAFTTSSEKLKSAQTGLKFIASKVGMDSKKVMDSVRDLTKDGLMSVAEASGAMKNFLLKGFNIEEAKRMVMMFKDFAAFGRQGALDFGEAILGASEGIKDDISAKSDNAGMTKNLGQIYLEYARKIHKTTLELTEQDKVQALLTGVGLEWLKVMGLSQIAADTLEGEINRTKIAMEDLKVTLGIAMAGELREFHKWLQLVIKRAGEWATANREKIGRTLSGVFEVVESLTKALIDLAGKVGPFFDKLKESNIDWGGVAKGLMTIGIASKVALPFLKEAFTWLTEASFLVALLTLSTRMRNVAMSFLYTNLAIVGVSAAALTLIGYLDRIKGKNSDEDYQSRKMAAEEAVSVLTPAQIDNIYKNRWNFEGIMKNVVGTNPFVKRKEGMLTKEQSDELFQMGFRTQLEMSKAIYEGIFGEFGFQGPDIGPFNSRQKTGFLGIGKVFEQVKTDFMSGFSLALTALGDLLPEQIKKILEMVDVAWKKGVKDYTPDSSSDPETTVLKIVMGSLDESRKAIRGRMKALADAVKEEGFSDLTSSLQANAIQSQGLDQIARLYEQFAKNSVPLTLDEAAKIGADRGLTPEAALAEAERFRTMAQAVREKSIEDVDAYHESRLNQENKFINGFQMKQHLLVEGYKFTFDMMEKYSSKFASGEYKRTNFLVALTKSAALKMAGYVILGLAERAKAMAIYMAAEATRNIAEGISTGNPQAFAAARAFGLAAAKYGAIAGVLSGIGNAMMAAGDKALENTKKGADEADERADKSSRSRRTSASVRKLAETININPVITIYGEIIGIGRGAVEDLGNELDAMIISQVNRALHSGELDVAALGARR